MKVRIVYVCFHFRLIWSLTILNGSCWRLCGKWQDQMDTHCQNHFGSSHLDEFIPTITKRLRIPCHCTRLETN